MMAWSRSLSVEDPSVTGASLAGCAGRVQGPQGAPRPGPGIDPHSSAGGSGDVRFIRRLQRDGAQRGRTTDSIIAQYLTTVRPGHEHYIEPSKRFADVVLPQGGYNEPALELLLARVQAVSRGD